MGNAMISPCCPLTNLASSSTSVKVVFWKGVTRILTGKHIAGELMFDFPDMIVCHADSFFIGQPVPALSIDDELLPGETYFLLPIDRFACKLISASLLPSFVASSSKPNSPINFGHDCPFQYVKGSNGRVQIKVAPEFIKRLITVGNEKTISSSKSSSSGNSDTSSPNNGSFLCSTPELQKHFHQLVGSKEQVWSPKLETISEQKIIRVSPCRFLRLEWRSKEVEG